MRRRRPILLGDLGGTHARFATVMRRGARPDGVAVRSCADFPTAEEAMLAYMEARGIGPVAQVCLAVAGPVDHDPVDLSNNPWTLRRTELERAVGAPVVLVNDFTAQALALDLLRPDELEWLGVPRPAGRGIRTVVGPGTGLGVSVLTTSGEVVPSEAGHVGFAPADGHQLELVRALHSRFRRVSVERLVSGPGIENLYWANHQLAAPASPRKTGAHLSAPEVARRAQEGDAVALRSVEDFFDALAAFAGDLALAMWSTGGVYLSGGALQKLAALLDAERFRARFEDKGRFTSFCESVPVARILHAQPGLLGCSAALARGASGSDPIGAGGLRAP